MNKKKENQKKNYSKRQLRRETKTEYVFTLYLLKKASHVRISQLSARVTTQFRIQCLLQIMYLFVLLSSGQ